MSTFNNNHLHLAYIYEKYLEESSPYRKVRRRIDVVNLMIRTFACYGLNRQYMTDPMIISKFKFNMKPLSPGAWVSIIHQTNRCLPKSERFDFKQNFLDWFVSFRNEYFHMPLPGIERCHQQLKQIDEVINQFSTIEFISTTKIVTSNKEDLTLHDAVFICSSLLDDQFSRKLFHPITNEPYYYKIGEAQLLPLIHPYNLMV